MTLDAQWIKSILPDHYTCNDEEDGVNCKSTIGIEDTDAEHWWYIYMAIKQKFGERFMEIYHQTSTNHQRFTIYLKK